MTSTLHSIYSVVAATGDNALDARGLLAMSRVVQAYDAALALDLIVDAHDVAQRAGHQDARAARAMSLQFVGDDTLCSGWYDGYDIALDLPARFA